MPENRRPYRFGMIWAILNIAGGAFYACLSLESFWRWSSSPHSNAGILNFLGAIFLIISSIIALGTGLGLLRRHAYGIHFLNLSLLIANVTQISRWWTNRSVHSALWVLGLIAFTVSIEIYFQKRAPEFLSRVSVSSEFRWTRWSAPGGKGYAVAEKVSLMVAAASAIWIYHVTPHWWLAVPASLVAWLLTPYLWSILWGFLRRFIWHLEETKFVK